MSHCLSDALPFPFCPAFCPTSVSLSFIVHTWASGYLSCSVWFSWISDSSPVGPSTTLLWGTLTSCESGMVPGKPSFFVLSFSLLLYSSDSQESLNLSCSGSPSHSDLFLPEGPHFSFLFLCLSFSVFFSPCLWAFCLFSQCVFLSLPLFFCCSNLKSSFSVLSFWFCLSPWGFFSVVLTFPPYAHGCSRTPQPRPVCGSSLF